VLWNKAVNSHPPAEKGPVSTLFIIMDNTNTSQNPWHVTQRSWDEQMPVRTPWKSQENMDGVVIIQNGEAITVEIVQLLVLGSGQFYCHI
jgi:hypothetical protein